MKKKTSGKLTNIVLVLIFLAGLSLLLYPTVSDYWNSLHASRAVSEYAEQVNALDRDRYKDLWKQAVDYNRTLLDRVNSFTLTEEQQEQYEELLNLSGTGIMGYIEIPNINVSLPVYHGTAESVLQIAVGHVDWTSLPVGGEGTHCVLSGHRGGHLLHPGAGRGADLRGGPDPHCRAHRGGRAADRAREGPVHSGDLHPLWHQYP